MSIRALLVDDEAPARDRLRRMLAEFDGLEVVGEAADGGEALERVATLRPDLLFLDIEMPGLSGIEVVKRLALPRPRIVFCTAYDQYAIAAFEHRASDYLLKPVSRARLAEALARLRQTLDEELGLRREVDAAGEAQARLFPQSAPTPEGLEIAGLARPAQRVGGDYYDFLRLGPGRTGLVLGDVSGKGLAAGLLMASLQARVQSLAPLHGARVADLALELNRALHSSTADRHYSTLFYGVYEAATRELVYVNAGHPPGLVVRAGATHRLPSGGPPIGLLAETAYRPGVFALQPADAVCLFSDGITEALDPSGQEFGLERLVDVLQNRAEPQASCLAVLEAVERFTDAAAPQDDRTVIVGRVR